METKTGKRTAHFKVQIVEDPNRQIHMWIEEPTLRKVFGGPINFSKLTGQSDAKTWEKLHAVIEAS
jgi:hypothetical protein